MNLPDFLILGETKCGTTSLFNYLIQHPNIIDTKGNGDNYDSDYKTKEIRYFDRYYQKGIDWYSNCFKETGKDDITGEATPMYLYRTCSINRIKETLPQAKFIILLREPFARLYSNYNHNFKWVSGFQEKYPDFRIFWNSFHDSDAYLIEKGLYYYTLIKWFDSFDKSRFLILKSEDMYSHTQVVYSETLKFLGVKNHFLADFKPFRRNEYEPTEISLRKEIESFYAPYNDKLYKLLGRTFWHYQY